MLAGRQGPRSNAAALTGFRPQVAGVELVLLLALSVAQRPVVLAPLALRAAREARSSVRMPSRLESSAIPTHGMSERYPALSRSYVRTSGGTNRAAAELEQLMASPSGGLS